MNKKVWIMAFTASFALLYILFGFWIAKDTETILDKAMAADPTEQEYMDPSVFNRINPVTSGATTAAFSYDSSKHSIGIAVPLHFFFVAKVFVTHAYDETEFGFKEPVSMDLKLKNGHWYAANVKIEP
ncbi:hypothetical protein QPK24_02415 [Paenibacillus polygoni]|uniref:Uncharacterized protein n=1 Tax=Paenibacillus polygoni TaxID=3050112 RepID=A0ABY8X557_9BACL|nr:hypothetical protein [Paenibacillus polygoni]WIV19621.1 hypothetical protein QPK24_02415 [Paenibacillus polygoni]